MGILANLGKAAQNYKAIMILATQCVRQQAKKRTHASLARVSTTQCLLMLEGVPKKVEWDEYQNRHSSKTISVIKLSFCQNDPQMG